MSKIFSYITDFLCLLLVVVGLTVVWVFSRKKEDINVKEIVQSLGDLAPSEKLDLLKKLTSK